MINILLEGTKSGSRWRERGVLPSLDMTKFHCFIETTNNIPDWVLFVVTPRDVEVTAGLDYVDDKSKMIFVPHNLDFSGDIDMFGPDPSKSMHFTAEQKEILDIIGKRIREVGGKYFPDIKTTVDFFNSLTEE